MSVNEGYHGYSGAPGYNGNRRGTMTIDKGTTDAKRRSQAGPPPTPGGAGPDSQGGE